MGLKYRKKPYHFSYQIASWNAIEKHQLKKRVRKFQNETEETIIITLDFNQGDSIELTDEDITGFKGFINLVKEKIK